MTPGIKNVNRLAAAVNATSNTVLAVIGAGTDTAFTFPILAGQRVHVRACIPFTVGAAGGIKFRLDGPAAPTSYSNVQELNDGVTATPGAQIVNVITAYADFAFAFASVAGNHVMRMEADLEASVDGNVTISFAQNSSNATPLSIMKGAYLEATLF